MNFLPQKLKALAHTVATGAQRSIRTICAVSRIPYETARRQLSKLSKLKEAYARFVLERYCGKDVALVVIDPTYLKKLVEGIIAAGLLVPGLGRCIPLYWECFNWKELEKNPDGLYSRNLFQESFIRKLKKLVYPRKLVIIADREFGRTRLFEVLRKSGIYWVIRVPKTSYPPKLGDYMEFSDEAHDEPWLLSYRLPQEYNLNPAELYYLRMRIEQTFKDAKSALSMRVILNGVKNQNLKDGLILLLFSAWLLLAEAGMKAKESKLLPESILRMGERGYYSRITIGRLCLAACAMSALAESLE